VRADYVKKYQPQKIPAWLFPIIFEEGGGQRDTIYLGYDEDASNQFGGADTMFGEYKEPLDSLFHAYWGSLITNKVIKNTVKETLYSGISITFHKGHLPLTMWWDAEAFYSDSLPFADRDPAPRAQGQLWLSDYSLNPDSSSWCPPVDEMLLTDTFLHGGPAPCWRTDSAIFQDFFNRPGYPAGLITLFIKPWQGLIAGVQPGAAARPALKIYPNPVREQLYITSIGGQWAGMVQLKVSDVYGQLWAASESYLPGTAKITTEALPLGGYWLTIESAKWATSYFFVKTNWQ